MTLRSFPLLASLFLFSTCVSAQTEVGVAALPDWAERLPIQDFTTDRTAEFQLGVAYLLDDRQIRKTHDGYEYVERAAYRVIDRSGLESAARILRSFDPENETLSFNFVRILRDDEVIDRLTDAEITLLRQENGLQSSIIDGNVTALIQLEDVRVGDVIDYSYSGSVTSRLWPEHVFEAAPVQWSVPLAQYRFRLVVPEDLRVTTRSVSTELEPDVEARNGWKSFELDVRDPDPVPFEQNVAGNWVMYGLVAFTTMESWSDIVDWALPLFSFDEPLPPGFIETLDEIARAHDRPEDRAVQALRLVQSDIRYLGLEVGLGSHVPRAPAVTLERGYGDCKDKSVLLVSALSYLGIDAAPALVSVASGHVLPQLPPTIGAFDHVIVQVDIGGQKLWMDPTLSHQGGTAENLARLGYGYVLPIRKEQTELVQLNEPLPDEPGMEIAETFEFPESGDVGLRVSVEEIYRNGLADFSRLQIANLGREGLGRSSLDYYAANYEGIFQSEPLTITDDLDANAVTFQSEYEMHAETFRQSGYKDNLPIFATAVQDILPRLVEANRTAPLALPYGTNVRHVVRIATPDRRFPLPRSKAASAPGVSYELNFGSEGDVFEIEYNLAVTEQVADLESIKLVTDIADEIATDSELNVYMNSAVPSLANRLGLSQPLDRETEDAVGLIATQIEQRDYVKSLTGLNELLARHEEATELRGALQVLKGEVLAELGRVPAALASFQEGFALYEPTTVNSYYVYIFALTREREASRAAEVALRMLERHPEAVESINHEWISSFSQHLRRSDMEAQSDSIVVGIARAAHEMQPDNLEDFGWIFRSAVQVLSRSGDTSEARRYLPHLTNPRVIAELMASRDTEAVWNALEQEAGADLSTAIAAYVSSTRDAAAEAPDDFQALTQHLQALRMAGRLEEAVRFGEPFARNWPQIEAVGRDAYWFVNEYAYVLSDAGRAEEAHELMMRLVEIDVSQNGQLVSMAINRAALLMHWEKFEAALAAAGEIEALGDGYASDYGWMWVYNVKACSLHRLNRAAEAEAVLRDSIVPLAEANPAAHTKTMLCLDEQERAAKIIIERLRDEEDRQSAVFSFIEVANRKSVPPFLAELQRRASRVRSRPEVQSEFAEVGRALSMNGAGTYWGSNF